MNRIWKLMLFVPYPVIALAQTGPSGTSGSGSAPPYQPVVPAAPVVSPYGGYPGYYSGNVGGTTPAGSAMNGMASMMSAAGQRNLANSAAAVNMTQAQKNEIENRNLATNTYFQMRATNKAARDAERGPPPTMEQLARIAKEGEPKPLGSSQMDHVNGQLQWPSALQQPAFESQRREVDLLFAQRAIYGGLGYADQMKVRRAIEAMFDQLKEQIRDIPPQDYVECRSFLQSTIYAATKTEL